MATASSPTSASAVDESKSTPPELCHLFARSRARTKIVPSASDLNNHVHHPVPVGAPKGLSLSLSTLQPGEALCLSGGGKRATFFHIGVLRRLNELGRLKTLKCVSSVSGGSITAAYLALCWNRFDWKPKIIEVEGENKTIGIWASNFEEIFANPLLNEVASVDLAPIASGLLQAAEAVLADARDKIHDWLKPTSEPWLKPGEDAGGAAHVVAALLNEMSLFKGKTLGDFPHTHLEDNPAPSFFLNAMSVQTGNLFVFTRNALGEAALGYLRLPEFQAARAGAASAAFPIVLSPYIIHLDPNPVNWEDSDSDDKSNAPSLSTSPGNTSPDLLYANYELTEMKVAHPAEYAKTIQELRSKVYLIDGGAFDNLGLEIPINEYKTVLVSDAGASMNMQIHPSREMMYAHPHRCLDLIDHGSRCERGWQFLERINSSQQDGLYWSIRGDILGHHPASDAKAVNELFAMESKNHQKIHDQTLLTRFSFKNTLQLAKFATTFSKVAINDAKELANWGYVRFAVVDATKQGRDGQPTVEAQLSRNVPIVVY